MEILQVFLVLRPVYSQFYHGQELRWLINDLKRPPAIDQDFDLQDRQTSPPVSLLQ